MKTITKETPIAEALALMAEDAQRAKNDQPRDCTTLPVGDVAQQGDVYIHVAPTDHPHGPRLATRQLAEGDTQGSRHIAEGHVKIYAPTTPTASMETGALLGPVVVATGPWTLTHPEHPHHHYGPGTYAIVHQLDAITGSAVRD